MGNGLPCLIIKRVVYFVFNARMMNGDREGA